MTERRGEIFFALITELKKQGEKYFAPTKTTN